MKVFLLGLSFFASKLLGLARDHFLASSFGAGAGAGIFNLDTYYAAFRLPDLLFNLLSYGVLSAGFVPLFAEIVKKESRESAWKFSQQALFTFSGIIFVISIILFFAADPLVSMFVPGFSPVDREITVSLTRLMLLTPLIFTIGSLCGGIQNALGKVVGLALAPIFYNIGIIGGILFGAERYGVYAVAIGVLVGAFLHLAVQLPGVIRSGFRFTEPFKIWSARVKEMVALSIPRIVGMSVSQLSLVVDTIIASTLAAGSITVLNLAINLESLPMSIVGISIAIVSFTTLSNHAAEKNMPAFIEEVRINLRRIFFLLIPATVGMFMLRFDIVKILFTWGRFSGSNAYETAQTLGIFLSGLVFASIVFLLARAFYALKNTKTPVVISIFAVAVNIGASLFFTRVIHLNTYGLAIANACADTINAVLLAAFLMKRLGASIFDLREIVKGVVAAITMALPVYLARVFIPQTIVAAAVSIILGVVTYGGLMYAMKSVEVKIALARFIKVR